MTLIFNKAIGSKQSFFLTEVRNKSKYSFFLTEVRNKMNKSIDIIRNPKKRPIPIQAKRITPQSKQKPIEEELEQELKVGKKKENLLMLVILIILSAVFFATLSTTSFLKFFKLSSSQPTPEPVQTAKEDSTSPQETQTAAPTAAQTNSTPTAPATIDKSTVSIKILNGTTINGLAAKIKTTLVNDGWKVDSIGNAKNRYNTTIIYFKEGKENIADEVEKLLEDRETSSKQDNAIVGKYDIVVVLGLR